jgi:hypothetical protein
VGAPSYDAETLATYFMPPGRAIYADPIAGPVLRRLERDDPDILLAVADVDRSQIRQTLARDPEERLRACFRSAATFEELRRGAR